MHKPTKNIFFTSGFSLVLLLPMFWSSAAWSLDAYTERNVRLAALQCEHALAVKPPKTALALRVLQRYFKKYALYRDAATARDPSVWASDEQHPSGKRFMDKAYSDILSHCEKTLPKKIEQAEQALLQYQAKQEAAAQQKALAQQKAQQQAMQQVQIAIENYCQTYLRTAPPDTLNAATEQQLNQDYAAYTHARKAALALSLDIQQAEFKSLVKGAQAQQLLAKKQTVRAWFEYCEIVFADHLSKTVEAEGPPAPDSALIADTATIDAEVLAEAEAPKATATDKESTSIALLEEPSTPVEEQDKPIEDATESIETAHPIAEETPDSASHTDETIADESIDTAAAEEEVLEEDTPEAAIEEEPEVDEMDEAEAVEDEAVNAVEDEYSAILAKAKTDRAKILKKERRVPEYLDEDQEDALASKEWFYEDYDKNDNPSACRIYVFSGHKLKEQESFKGSCFEE